MENQEAIIQILIFGTIGMGTLVIAIILFVVVYQKKLLSQKAAAQEMELQYQKELINATFRSQEAERLRIARDLHDDLAGDLSAIRISISRLSKQMTDPDTFSNSVSHSKSMLNDSIEKVRGIARELMPPTLHKLGLAVSLKELATRLEIASGITIHYTQDEMLPVFSEEINLSLYRVTQELLNNALKHSQATGINIHLQSTPFSISIADNGVGFESEKVTMKSAPANGMGLKSIESRLQMIGANLALHTSPGKGTKAEITL
ncbi:MAG: sensor histidine kinase [Bacteroidia bacterium]